MAVAEGLEPPCVPSDVFVEGVRVLIVATATAAGHSAAGATGAALGACAGYVLGGVVGRWVRRATSRFERSVERTPAMTLAAGGIGALVLGALGAVLGLAAVVLLPGGWGWGVFGLATWIGACAGFQVGAGKGAELLDSRTVLPPASAGRVLIDSSAAMDDRLLVLGRCDFLAGHLAVPCFVVDELHGLADASDDVRRRRARRGLEVLDALAVEVLPDEVPQRDDVAGKVAVLAERLGAPVLTAGDLDRLAEGLRAGAVPGEIVHVRLAREGRDPGQAVGYLADGDMVVVSDAADRVGDEVDAEVLTTVPTSKGRLHFAVLRA